MRIGRKVARRAFVIGLVLAAGFVPAACDSSSPAADPGTTASADQTSDQASGVLSVEAAVDTAQAEFGMLTGGDYGHAWDLWTAAAQASVPRANFVALGSTCTAMRGVPYEVLSSRRVDQYTVDVSYRRANKDGTSRLTFYSDAWHYQPTDAELASYQAGNCG